MNRRIWLAAGHALPGDPGAQGQGTNEAAQTVDITNRLAAKLKADRRLEVLIVPHTLNLGAQIRWVNARAKGIEDGYAVEIHKNSAKGNATGVETWYREGAEDSRKLADKVTRQLSAVSRLRNRGIKKDTDNRHGTLGWVRQTKVRAGLYECGFIDFDHLNNELYAEGMFRGLLDIFGLKDAVPDLYRVLRNNGQQVGAYRVRSNAWKTWLSIRGEGVIRNREGADVTSQFIAEFGSSRIAPDHVEPPDPAEDAIEIGDVHDIEHDIEDDTEEVIKVGLLPEDDTEEIPYGN
jgi:hypothetical protein